MCFSLKGIGYLVNVDGKLKKRKIIAKYLLSTWMCLQSALMILDSFFKFRRPLQQKQYINPENKTTANPNSQSLFTNIPAKRRIQQVKFYVKR